MSEQWMPKDKPELMSAIEREWNLLIQVAEKLTARQMSTPDTGGWSPKDNLAHVAAWMKVLMEYHMDKRSSDEVLGVSEEIANGWDFNQINQFLFERNTNRTQEDVLSELKQVYAQLHARLESMSFEDLMKPYNATEKAPILSWVIGNTVDHFAEHRQTIEKTL
jgi:hypothetical protein